MKITVTGVAARTDSMTIPHLWQAGYDPAAIQYDMSRYVGAKSKCFGIGKLRRILPGFAPRPLAEGLPPVIRWVGEYLLTGQKT